MTPLEGANCADLPAFVIDKYFDCNVHTERFYAQTAKAICSHCVVLEECRTEALAMPHLPRNGVIGGVTATELHLARSWRRYELGLESRLPRRPRPGWLSRADAAETTEQARIEADPDEY